MWNEMIRSQIAAAGGDGLQSMFRSECPGQMCGKNRRVRFVDVRENRFGWRERQFGLANITDGLVISRDDGCHMSTSLRSQIAKPQHLLSAFAAAAEPLPFARRPIGWLQLCARCHFHSTIWIVLYEFQQKLGRGFIVAEFNRSLTRSPPVGIDMPRGNFFHCRCICRLRMNIRTLREAF